MDIKKIQKLIKIIEDSDIAEIEINKGKESIRINRYPVTQQAPASTTSTLIITSPEDDTVVTEQKPKEHTIKSPMVGTFYCAASTTDTAFVEVGQSVFIGDTLCIIGAMKILNTIKADSSGIIKQILVNDDQPVEFGQPLFIIENSQKKRRVG